jgi:hypothetical protein
MKKEMYEMLNRAEIDFNEYEEIPLSKEEKAEVKTRIQKEIRNTGGNRFRKQVAAAALFVVIMTVGAVGVSAAAGYKSVSDAFKDIFKIDRQTEELAENQGKAVGDSVTCNGMTVTLDAMIGDEYNVAFVYTLEKEDGSSFDYESEINEESGLDQLQMYFESDSIKVKKNQVSNSMTTYFYDDDTSDNKIQYVQIYNDNDKINGKTASICLKNLCQYKDTREEPNLEVKGTWNFKVKLNYETQSREIATGENITMDGINMTIQGFSISPVGIHLEASVDNDEFEKNAEQYTASFDEKTVMIYFKNGESLDLSDVGYSVSKGNNNQTIYTTGTEFNRIIDLDEIKFIQIGDKILDDM